MTDKFRSDPEYTRNYMREYYKKKKAKLKSRSMRRYYKIRDNPEFKEKVKRQRELRHFGTDRQSIFDRSDGKCVDCGGPAVVVHHLDNDGRTNESKGVKPGHNPDRMVGLCRSCHMKRHWQELFEVRRGTVKR